MEYLPDNVMKP